jgi:hypothetical protein
MTTPVKLLYPLLCTLTLSLHADDRPWQTLSDPTVKQVAAQFATPPTANSSQVTWGWSGTITREVIARDLDHLKSMNVHAAWVEPGRNAQAPYLSPAYFENVKIAVEEAKKRNMHLWFDDDGGYPSGFAGGKFTNEHPELDMKGLAAPEQIAVAAGETFTRPVDKTLICAVALNLETGEPTVIKNKGEQVTWTAPATGRWAVILSRWAFRSGVTKSANNQAGTKNNEHSLMDYLSPEANQQFIEWTFEAYKKAVGDEFGKTFLGFRGDEASFGFNPWTPDFPAEFEKRKGYDVRPYLPAIAAIQIGHARGQPAPAVSFDPAHRAFADYCDVWSDLFGKNFFSAGARWCADHQLEMQVHIEHEEILPQLAISNGDFFKCMRDIQIPGVDVIWHQLWHDVIADFPKLASSAAHLNGRPQSMSETFAAMGGNYPTPNLEEAGWILNHQIALGITHFEYMAMSASTADRPGGARRNQPAPEDLAKPKPVLPRGVAPAGYRYLNDPDFPALAQTVNRTTFLLEQGRPTAQIGVYIPSSSFWFNSTASNRSFVDIVHALLSHQRDVDFVDEIALSETLTARGGELLNKSGTGYRAIIIPAVEVISQAALDRLRAFARAGGKVIIVGEGPKLAMSKNFLTAQPPGDLSWAMTEKSGAVTSAVLAALPTPDFKIDHDEASLKYNHRQLKDGDVYFLFNEGETPIKATATLATHAHVKHAQSWDAASGKIDALTDASVGKDTATVTVELAPFATKLIVLSSTPPGA